MMEDCPTAILAKRSGMDHYRLVFDGGAQGGINGIAHPGSHGTGDFKVAGGDRIAFLIISYGDFVKPFAAGQLNP